MPLRCRTRVDRGVHTVGGMWPPESGPYLGENGYKAERQRQREHARDAGRRPLASALVALGVLAGTVLVGVLVLALVSR